MTDLAALTVEELERKALAYANVGGNQEQAIKLLARRASERDQAVADLRGAHEVADAYAFERDQAVRERDEAANRLEDWKETLRRFDERTHTAEQRADRLAAALEEATRIIEDAWNQWAYPSNKPRALHGKWPGGLSTLECIEQFLVARRDALAASQETPE